MPRVRAAAGPTRAQRLQRWRRVRARQWSDSRSQSAVLSVTTTPTDVASAAAPTPAAAAAVPSVSVAAAAAAAPAPSPAPSPDTLPVVCAMMCLRHREEYPLGPHCPRILQFSTNVLEEAAAQLERLRAEHAAVSTAALEAEVDRAYAACLAHDAIEYASSTEHLAVSLVWQKATMATFRRSDQLDLMPRATVPCPDGCTRPDCLTRKHIPFGACLRCTTRDTESISAHFSAARMQKHSCFNEQLCCAHGFFGLRPLGPDFSAQL